MSDLQLVLAMIPTAVLSVRWLALSYLEGFHASDTTGDDVK